MLLALIVWIGGIVFFAFVEAPTLFSVLPTTKLAGDVVSASLTRLHWMGLISGIVFLSCSLIYNWQKHQQFRPFALSHILAVLDAGLDGLLTIWNFAAYACVAFTIEMVEKPGYDPYIAGSVPNLIARYSAQFNQPAQMVRTR